jgi:hypothetical protein
LIDLVRDNTEAKDLKMGKLHGPPFEEGSPVRARLGACAGFDCACLWSSADRVKVLFRLVGRDMEATCLSPRSKAGRHAADGVDACTDFTCMQRSLADFECTLMPFATARALTELTKVARTVVSLTWRCALPLAVIRRGNGSTFSEVEMRRLARLERAALSNKGTQ